MRHNSDKLAPLVLSLVQNVLNRSAEVDPLLFDSALWALAAGCNALRDSLTSAQLFALMQRALSITGTHSALVRRRVAAVVAAWAELLSAPRDIAHRVALEVINLLRDTDLIVRLGAAIAMRNCKWQVSKVSK
jgi:hypothetical protein